MGRLRQHSSEPDETEVDISPLIDCVFILLIFFIVTTVFVEEPGVEINKPVAYSGKNLEKNTILVAVTAEGAVVFGGREIGVGGVRPLIKRMTMKEQIPVILQVDQSASSAVMIRVIEETKLAGAEKVFICTRDGSP